MMTFRTWLEKLKKSAREVVCFGTGLMAEEALKYDAIRNAVLFFADNDARKQGRKLQLGDSYYSVVSPETMKERLKGNEVILVTSGYYKSIREQLKKMDLPDTVEIVDFAVMRVSYSPDSEEFFEERILKESLKEYEIVLDQYKITDSVRERLLGEKEAYIKGCDAESRPFVIPRIMIMPTTRCNMRCKGCSSLLPKFNKPCDVDINRIIEDFEIFFSGIDECIRITVGGEPFLYPNLKDILEYLLKQNKVLGIMLITNSTLLPSQRIVELLKSPKILVEISDYGHLERMSKLIRLLEDNEVNFKVLTNQTWTDMGDEECRNRSAEELRFNYMNCNQSRVIKGFHDGWFYTCARSARMMALGAYTSERDRFKLSKEDSPESIRQKLKAMFYSEGADACNYCDLGALPTKTMEAGVQMVGNIKKSKYTIVDREEYEELKRLAKLRK